MKFYLGGKKKEKKKFILSWQVNIQGKSLKNSPPSMNCHPMTLAQLPGV